MFDQIKLFFDRHLALPVPDPELPHKLQIACAALLIEMMYMDDRVHDEERDMLESRIQDVFSLTQQDTNELVALAVQQREQATDYYQFTSLINKEFTMEQKIDLVRSLWQIAYADGELDEMEEYLVRKVSELLYVPHQAFIMTKNEVNGG